jgi:DNA mismatch repair protein MutL
MGPEDALLCLQRHATSKITKAEDLSSVSTMGFRGEALASIAAISKITIQTCRESGLGSQVEVEAGIIGTLKPCARNRGTTIEVRQLFYNVPARRKFQKSAALCSLDILKTLTGLSLANPRIGFEFYEQEVEKLKLPRGEGSFLEALKKRSLQVLGASFLEEAVCVEGSFDSFSFKGIIGGIQNTRPNKVLQYSFINERAVLCPALSYAVKDAFGTRINHDRFPIYALHLNIPGPFLDVNVHPQKKEVRLREEKWIKEQLKQKIQEELFVQEKSLVSSSLSSSPLSYNLFSSESFFTRPRVETELLFESSVPLDSIQTPLFVEKNVVPIGVYRHFLWVDAASTQAFNLGIEQGGVLIVDLKAASSRLLFDSLQEEEKISQQSLLLPLSFSCSLAEAEQMLLNEKELDKMGFSLRSVGKQSFLIEAIPSCLPEEEAIDFLKIAFMEEKGESCSMKKERVLARTCTRLISQRRENYSMHQALQVLYALSESKSPLFCPLGNKTIVQIGDLGLERLFTKVR